MPRPRKVKVPKWLTCHECGQESGGYCLCTKCTNALKPASLLFEPTPLRDDRRRKPGPRAKD